MRLSRALLLLRVISFVLNAKQTVLKCRFIRCKIINPKWEFAMGKLSLSLSFVLLFMVLLPPVSTALADRGMIPVEPGVSIYEPGQKAIVAWNGQEETLILSTDVNAADNTLALEIMPLPSNPKQIEKASFESFITIQDIIWKHAPEVFGRGYLGPESTKSVEVTFHEKIGAHDITVVKASDALELTTWAEDFLELNNVSQEISLQKFETVIEDYMARGFRFFVLDLIEISPNQKSVAPILYQFETGFLYYPLKISSPISGDTKITLFLLTNGEIENPLYFSPWNPLRKASYRSPSLWEPIEFNLTKGQLGIIDLRIAEMFQNGACLTVMEYEGPLSGLIKDLVIAERDLENPSQVDSQGNVAFFILVGMFAAGATCTLVGVILTFTIIRLKTLKRKTGNGAH